MDQKQHIERAMRATGGSQTKLAKALGVSQQIVSKIYKGKQRITAEMAVKLERATSGAVPRWETRPDLWVPPGAGRAEGRAA